MRAWPVVFALAAVLAGGCSVLPGSGTAVVPAPVREVLLPADTVDAALAYFEHARRIAPAVLAREHDSVRQLYARSLSEENRMRYAIVLSVPGTPFSDEARALDALDPLVKNTNARLHRVALLLSAQIQEQRRGRTLQQKLDALITIDKELLERSGKTGGRR